MKIKFNKAFLLISLFAGLVVGFLLDMVIEWKNEFGSDRILGVTVYLAAFALLVGIVILIKSVQTDAFANMSKIMVLVLAAFIAFTAFSALFEYIYEIEPKAEDTAKFTKGGRYVFAIDNSGSMNWNDPSNQRFDSLETIVHSFGNTKNFGVYVFTEDTVCVTEFGSKKATSYKFPEKYRVSDGENDVLKAINTIISDVDDGKPLEIIVLADGDPYSYEFTYEEIVKLCKKKKVAVSSVGFGNIEGSFLQDIADETGGTYYLTDNVEGVSEGLEFVTGISNGKINRDLLSRRLDHTENKFLYALMRVAFLTVLGGLWTIIKLLLIGEKKFTKKAAVISILLCFLGALIMEVYFGIGGDGEPLARILLCVLWACTLIPEADYNAPKIDENKLNDDIMGGVKKADASSLFTNDKKEVGSKSFL